MTRLLGALFLTGSGLLAGLLAAGGLRERVEVRAELAGMLKRMEFELGRFSTPLPALFERLGGQLTGCAGALCRQVSVGLRELGERTLEEIWAGALQALPPEERRMLLPLGQVLGRYGTEEQLMALAACREGMERIRDEARSALQAKSRMLVGVSTAGAAVLAVLLL